MGSKPQLSAADLAMLTLRQVDGGHISMGQLHDLILDMARITAQCCGTHSAESEAMDMACDAIDPELDDPIDPEYVSQCLNFARVAAERSADKEAAQATADSIALHADMRAAAIVEARRQA